MGADPGVLTVAGRRVSITARCPACRRVVDVWWWPGRPRGWRWSFHLVSLPLPGARSPDLPLVCVQTWRRARPRSAAARKATGLLLRGLTPY